MRKEDELFKLLAELFNSIKPVKLYAYEPYFFGRIKQIRSELRKLKTDQRQRKLKGHVLA